MVGTAPPRLVAAGASRSVSRKARNKKGRPSYASLPRTMLAAERVRSMTGLGLRVLLTAHAYWRGRPPLLLPTKTVPNILGMERCRFARGRTEVVAAGFLVETKPFIRPGGAGGKARGVQRAAEWDLPHAHRDASIPLDHGDERLPGYWRLLSADLLQIVGVCRSQDGQLRPFLTDDQLRVLIVLVQGPRTKSGALADPTKERMTAQDIVDRLPRLTLRTAQRALTALEARNLARKVGGGAGCAPGVYQPDGLLSAGLPWKCH